MHQKRTKKLLLLTTWRIALTTKRTIFLFFSERHLCRKKTSFVLFALPNASEKDKKNCSFWLHEEWLSPQKEQIFCSFLNVICTFCLAKCIRKGKQMFSFWLHEEWLSPQKEQLFWFLSERHLSRKERHLYFVPCQMHQKRTTKLFLLTTWRMASLHKKSICFCSFLNIIFLENRRSFVLFALPNASEKDKQNCSFWLHEEWLSPQKEQLFCSFLNVIFLEKNVICTFCLAKCIRKGQKNNPFDYMKNGSLHKKS